MTERINIGDSFYKDIDVSYTEDGEQYPVDLSIYDDNYVAIKRSRDTPDSEAYLLKRIFVKGAPDEGILSLDLSPEETSLLPQTNEELSFIEGFVQIGSSVTGHIHEVSSFRIKTRNGGIGHITAIDKSYDMGCIAEQVGWIFDAGSICEQVTDIIVFDQFPDGDLVYDAGAITSVEVSIDDFGSITDEVVDLYDLGSILDCRGLSAC